MDEPAFPEELELRPWIALNPGHVAPTLPFRITDGQADLGYFRDRAMARAALDALESAVAADGGPRQPSTPISLRVLYLERQLVVEQAARREAVEALTNRIGALSRILASRTDHLV